MDIHLPDTQETHSPHPDSVYLQETLSGSPPKSPFLPPKESLDAGNSYAVPEESNLPNISSHEGILDETSISHLFDMRTPEDEEIEESPSSPSPVNTYSWSSGWSEPRDFSTGDMKPLTHYFRETSVKRSGWSSPVWFDEKPYMVGAGLGNLGNTCFLNAVMQCFTHTVPLVQGLRSYDHAMPCERNSNGFCVLCAFRGQIDVSLASTGRVVYPSKFVENLSYLSLDFQRYQQEDAHEFLQCFLDRLDSCCTDSKTKDMSLVAHQDNFVKQCFGGRLVSKLKCCKCGHFSDTYEASIDLSMEIEDVNTLHAALESFTKVEKIEDPDTKFTCENCNEEVSIEKQLMLEETPSVAAFHLKRFKNNGSYVEKIDKFVEFPLELDLKPYTTSNQVELKYHLYAVVVHVGISSTFGHYYCFIRSAPDTWYKFDDSKVVRVWEHDVLSQEAYILFYSKQEIQWFSSYLESIKPSLDPHISNTSPKSVLDNVDVYTLSPSNATNHNHDVDKTSNAADEIFVGSPDRSRDNKVDGTKDDDETRGVSSTLYGRNAPTDETCNVKKLFSPSVLEESQLKQDEIKSVADSSPQTPPRTPSPDIYKDESPEIELPIKRNHFKLVNQLSGKKQLKKDCTSPETKEALRLVNSLPSSSRRKSLFAALGSRSEGSQNNKRMRMELSPYKGDNRSRSRRKVGIQSIARPLTAGCDR